MTDQSDKPLATQIASWLTGQSFNNVLLIAILGAIWFGGQYCVTVAIPNHLDQIQKGYERIEKSNSEDRELILKQYDKWFDYLQRNDSNGPTGNIEAPRSIEEIWRKPDATEYANGLGIDFNPKEEAQEVREVVTREGHLVRFSEPAGCTGATSGSLRSLSGTRERSEWDEHNDRLDPEFGRYTPRTF